MNTLVSRWRAAKTSAALSILFLIVYGGCNWIAAHRANVSSLFFGWERNLPFVAWLIPAYLSLDLFFIGAPFLCLTKRELQVYARRITAAIVIAGVCFLVFPLKFGFVRPQTDGVAGLVFDWFRTVDAPYNLAPSLHAALLLLVADVYGRRARGITRWAVMAWFILIGLSPVLTYQHHLIDIVTGFMLAALCFYLFPDVAVEPSGNRNKRIGFYYAIGALGLTTAAILLGGWWLLLVWPAMSMGIVAGGYWLFGSAIYRKCDGKLPLSTRFVLGPCLLGQELSRGYYRRKCSRWDAVTSDVWIGSQLNGEAARQAIRAGVTAVLDLTAEFSKAEPFREITYRNIQVLDLTAPTSPQLDAMTEFITANVPNGIVYVHCKIGYSRSAAAVAAYLLATGTASDVEEAISMIRRARPSIVVRPEIVNALRLFDGARARADSRTFVLASTASALA